MYLLAILLISILVYKQIVVFLKPTEVEITKDICMNNANYRPFLFY